MLVHVQCHKKTNIYQQHQSNHIREMLYHSLKHVVTIVRKWLNIETMFVDIVTFPPIRCDRFCELLIRSWTYFTTTSLKVTSVIIRHFSSNSLVAISCVSMRVWLSWATEFTLRVDRLVEHIIVWTTFWRTDLNRTKYNILFTKLLASNNHTQAKLSVLETDTLVTLHQQYSLRQVCRNRVTQHRAVEVKTGW